MQPQPSAPRTRAAARCRCRIERSQSLSHSWVFTKSRDGGGAGFSIATAMVVSRLPAGCRVDSSASRPLYSASTATSAYQRPAASCPLAHFFPFASFCWLVIVSPLVAPPSPCIAFRRTAASHVHPQPPLFVCAAPAGCCVPSCHTASASRHAADSHVASCGTFALNPPARPLSQCHFRRTLSWRHGHRRRPQMHNALSRRRHCQRPLFPLV